LKILISNDDGIESPGIHALAEAAEAFGEVTVVAPHRERSTAGHSLTLHKPLRIFEVAPRRFATTGTPADCIYLGIREILRQKPDLILSGINAGANLGTDVHYSGTVAAAREGALLNVPSYAFSLVDHPGGISKLPRTALRYDVAARAAAEVLRATKDLVFPKHTLLNVNIPNLEWEAIQGMTLARQGIRYYANEVIRRADPRGKDYYWIGGAYEGFEPDPTGDCHALQEGKISLVPLSIDATHQSFFEMLGPKLSGQAWPPARK
jgi:5'-nucleotidase